jgi:DNA-binding transcriptional ArsR family regulator
MAMAGARAWIDEFAADAGNLPAGAGFVHAAEPEQRNLGLPAAAAAHPVAACGALGRAAAQHSTNQLTVAARVITFNHMVDVLETRLDTVFHALGDVTRRRMLRTLAEGERTVGQLAEPFQMSLAAASKHVKALEGAGLIRREIRGRIHICRLDAAPLSAASEWLRHYEQFWNARLDRLEELLRQDAGPPAPGFAPAPAVPTMQPRSPRAATRGASTPKRRKAKGSPR